MKGKQLFSLIWYLWNWHKLARVVFIFLFGLFFLFGAAYYGTRDRLPEVPEPIDLEGVHRLLDGSSPRYVTFTARPDFSRRIFRTGVWAPFWGNCPPDEIRELDASTMRDSMFDRFLGCSVNLRGRVNVGAARLVRKPAIGDQDRPAAVAFAPITGTGERLWVRSEVVAGDQVDMQPWLRGESFTGVLATLTHAVEALPKGLASQARHVLGSGKNAYAICPATSYTGKSLIYFKSHFWVPLKGSNTLYVWASEEFETTFAGTITGVLTPHAKTDQRVREQLLEHFRTVTGEPLPERIGLIELQTGQEYNRKQAGVSGVFLIYGMLLAGGGALGIVLYILLPGIWFRSWQSALGQLSSRSRPGEPSRTAPPTGGAERPRVSTAQSTPSSDFITDQPTGFLLPMEPVVQKDSHIAKHPRDARAHYLPRLLRFIPGDVLFVSLTQDFLHPNNPEGCFRILAFHQTAEEAEASLLNSGQRHPGLALEVLAVNGRPMAGTSSPAGALAEYDVRTHDYVLLRHAPSPMLGDRFVVTFVQDGFALEAHTKARATLMAEPYLTILGRVCTVGDSENGPCGGMRKLAGSGILRPIYSGE